MPHERAFPVVPIALGVTVVMTSVLALVLPLTGCTETRDTVGVVDAGAAISEQRKIDPADLPRAIPSTETKRDDITADDRRFAKALTGHTSVQAVGDLDAIKKRGVLRVLTRNNSTSYFLHRGVEAGFHYELAKMLAEDLGVRLEMVVPKASRDLIPWLLEGRGDIIISGLAADAPRIGRVHITRPYLSSPLVVVTRKGQTPRIDSIESLAGVTTLIQPSSSATKRLRQISTERNLKLDLRAARESVEAEDMLDLVANKEADAAVVPGRIARAELLVRDDLVIATELDVQKVDRVFAVRPEDEKLWAASESFLRRNVRGTLFNIFYKRFHENRRRTKSVHNEDLRADKDGQLTAWDDTFQKAARLAGVDWRLLAAQCFQESRFDPKAKSEWGAIGLMQMLPSTAKEVGVVDPWDPDQSILGGAKYLGRMVKRFEGDGIELRNAVRFALAAYNVGAGHVDDARKLATKMGKDKNRWFGNVADAMLLLSKPRYYRHARYGYARGTEPFRYVSEIQTRYDNYVALTDKRGPAPDALQDPSPTATSTPTLNPSDPALPKAPKTTPAG